MSGIFDQGGGKSFSFNNPGDVIEGTVQSFKVSQSTKFDSVNWKPTNDPDFWPSGDPKMQVVITMQTQLNDGSGEDDGLRNVYAVITSAAGTLFRSIKDAIKAAGGTDIEEGAYLQCWLAGYDPNSKNQRNPKKLYGANYRRPVGVFGQDQGQQSQPGGLVGPGGQGGQQQGQLPFNPQQGQQGPPQAQPAPLHFVPPQQGQQGPPQGQPPYGGQPQQGFQAPQFQQPAQQQPAPGQGVDFAAMGQQLREQHVNGQQIPAGVAHQPPAGPWGSPVDAAQQAQQWEPPRPADMHQPPANPSPEQQQAMQSFYGNPQAQQQHPPAAQPPAVTQQAQQPAGQAQPAGAGSGVDVNRVRALIGAQLDDEMIIQATGVDPALLNQLRNAG